MEPEYPTARVRDGVNTPDIRGALNPVLILSIVLIRKVSDVYHMNT